MCLPRSAAAPSPQLSRSSALALSHYTYLDCVISCTVAWQLHHRQYTPRPRVRSSPKRLQTPTVLGLWRGPQGQTRVYPMVETL
ncbi:hypothetical protein V5799_015434 [Amblyomma americanum]|uniref:Uncharacterized protein n=1 Tax=Amblyomma americanum TaxID=6943 RepID=A0AAQ4F7R3_AMBAM